MSTDPKILAGLLFGALVVSGCATTSIAGDLDGIREATASAMLPRVERDDVEVETGADVRELLGAPLTPDRAARIAILNNRGLRAALRDVGVARGDYVQAGLLPNPGFEFDVREPGEVGEPLQLEFFGEWNLTRVVLAPMRARAARAELEAARYRAASAVVEVGYRARAAFLGYQAAAARLAAANQALDAFAASRDAARALFEAGNIPGLDRATQEAAYESARVLVAELELEAMIARESVQRVLGLYGEETAWTAESELAELPDELAIADDLERDVLEASFALAETRSRLEAIARRTGIARTAGWLPDITVDGHTERDGDNWEVGGGAHVSLPIFDRQQGTRAAREAEFDALLERYLGMAVDVRSSARELAGRLRSAHARAKHFRDAILPARRRVLEQALLQYNAMQIDVFQLLQVQRELLDAELRRIEALREFWAARASFDALLTGHAVGVEPTSSAVSLGGASEDPGEH